MIAKKRKSTPSAGKSASFKKRAARFRPLTAGMLAAVLLLAAGFAVFLLARGGSMRLSIDGVPVTEEEFRRMMNAQTYQVSKDLSEEYGLQTGGGFWLSVTGEVQAYRVLADRTVEALKQHRALYGLARERGYVEDISYEALLRRVERENADREAKIARGEAVYGLSSFTTDLFLEYEADAIRTRYCDDPANPGMDIPEAELRSRYEATRETRFHQDDDLSVTYMKIDYERQGLSQAEQARLREKLETLRLESGPLYELAAADPELAPYVVRRELTSADYRAASREIPEILDLAHGLAEGERTAVTDEYGVLCLVECTARIPGGYIPYEDAMSYLQKDLREEAFDALIAQKAAEAQITGDMESVYQFTEQAVK